MSQVSIRWMTRSDMNRVLEIEKRSYDCPWSFFDFVGVLRQRNGIGMVAEIDGEVVGFMVYELHKNALELLNLAVDPVYRNNGVGSAMIDKLTSKLRANRRSKVTLQISEKNTHAHLFFSRHGFLATGVVKQPYEFGYSEDAYRFEYDVTNQLLEGLHV